LPAASAVQRTDYDGAWKEALARYFEPFLRLCFPAVHAGIDWSRGVTPLDQELQEVVRDADTGKHRVDKLFQVHRHDGTEEETLGCRVRFEYPCCKLPDLDRAVLERGNNPAALVILAHRAAQGRTRDPVQRKALKWALTRSLYERGYSKEDILELFRLIDWLVQLPQEQEVEFRRLVAEYEAQKHMPYITSIERLGREEGLQQGLQRGRQQGRLEGAMITRQHAVLDALEIRFGEVADAIRRRIQAIQDEARLRALLKSAIQAGSIEEVTQTL
jgi:hypothetical protein